MNHSVEKLITLHFVCTFLNTPTLRRAFYHRYELGVVEELNQPQTDPAITI